MEGAGRVSWILRLAGVHFFFIYFGAGKHFGIRIFFHQVPGSLVGRLRLGLGPAKEPAVPEVKKATHEDESRPYDPNKTVAGFSSTGHGD